MKKVLVGVLIALALLVCLMSCGGGSDSDQPPEKEDAEVPESVSQPESATFKIGETWTVDEQWSLTVDSVERTDERNPYSEKSPAAVYIINYTYSNLGYVDSSGLMDGLFFGMESMIVDHTGLMGYSYPGDVVNHPTEVPVGATCKAQSCIGVDNDGKFTLTEILYDGNENKQQATFVIDVE